MRNEKIIMFPRFFIILWCSCTLAPKMDHLSGDGSYSFMGVGGVLRCKKAPHHLTAKVQGRVDLCPWTGGVCSLYGGSTAL